MEVFDKVFTLRLSRPREYFHCAADNRLYELIRVPANCEELLASKLTVFHELGKVIENETAIYVTVPFDLPRNLEFILTRNQPLEETYISLILRAVTELVVQLHSKGLYGISFHPSNFSLTASGKLVLRNRFTLNCQPKRVSDDWLNYCHFVGKVAPSLPTDDKDSSMSRNFKLFLRTLETLKTADKPVNESLAEILTCKFLHQKSNILDDLVDDLGPLNEESLRKLTPLEVRGIGEREELESAGKAFNLSGETAKNSTDSDDHKRQMLFLKAVTNTFDKYRNEEGVVGKQTQVNLLTAIENALRTMEAASPLSALQLMKLQTKSASL